MTNLSQSYVVQDDPVSIVGFELPHCYVILNHEIQLPMCSKGQRSNGIHIPNILTLSIDVSDKWLEVNVKQ